MSICWPHVLSYVTFYPVYWSHVYYSRPSQYRPCQYRLPSNSAAHFKSQICFFNVTILPPNTAVSEYRQFLASPKNGNIGRVDYPYLSRCRSGP